MSEFCASSCWKCYARFIKLLWRQNKTKKTTTKTNPKPPKLNPTNLWRLVVWFGLLFFVFYKTKQLWEAMWWPGSQAASGTGTEEISHECPNIPGELSLGLLVSSILTWSQEVLEPRSPDTLCTYSLEVSILPLLWLQHQYIENGKSHCVWVSY